MKKKKVKIPSRRMKLKQWSAVVRSGEKCEVCGSTKFLQAHHLVEKSRFPDLQFDPKVGVCVCPTCHKFGKNSFHANPFWAFMWMLEHKPEQMKWLLEQIGLNFDFAMEEPTDAVPFGFHPVLNPEASPIVSQESSTDEGTNKNLARLRI